MDDQERGIRKAEKRLAREKRISETAFASQVEDALTRFGWRWMHQRPAKTEKGWRTALSGHKGFVDYVAVHAEKQRLLFIELKGDTGKTSPEQDEWLNDLNECVRWITLEPVPMGNIGGVKNLKRSKMIPSYEVYVWYPKDSDTMLEVLR